MNVVLFGATGMVGQSVLRECLLDPGVARVLAVGRSTTSQQHEKLGRELSGYDACFFCLGVSSAGMSEADYGSFRTTSRRQSRLDVR